MRRNQGRLGAWRSAFALSPQTREQLATILRPALREPARIRAVIRDFEQRASDFVEIPFAVANADPVLDQTLHDAERAFEALRDALRRLPPEARTLLLERLLLARAVSPRVLNDLVKVARLLRAEAVRVRAELAAQRRPGRPSDKRGQRFAAGIAEILEWHGVPPTVSRQGGRRGGFLAECLQVLFEAVGHPVGDLGTLLDAAVKAVRDLPPTQKVVGKPQKTF